MYDIVSHNVNSKESRRLRNYSICCTVLAIITILLSIVAICALIWSGFTYGEKVYKDANEKVSDLEKMQKIAKLISKISEKYKFTDAFSEISKGVEEIEKPKGQ